MLQKILLTVFLLISLHFAQAQFNNVMIDNVGDPNEVSIAINPKNINQLVAGANLNYCYRSNDGGATWVKQLITSASGVWGDPMIQCDTAGNFYYFHLSNPGGGWGTVGFLDRVVCQKSLDGGVTFPGDYYLGLVTNGKIQDKAWTAVDPQNNYIYCTWTQFDHYQNVPPGYNVTPNDSSIILFSLSTDGGLTWSTPKRISKMAGDCIDSDNTTEGAVPCVGPGGEVYVSWSKGDSVLFNKSIDNGATWLPNNTVAAQHIGGWELVVPGMNRTNGMTVSACDLSNSAYHGTIYINWSDTRNGSNNSDVFITKSTDGGSTWSPAKRVNDDADSVHQFLNWLCVDQSTGFVYVLFYDRRNHLHDDSTDVYLAYSFDGGNTFTNRKINATPFVPTSNVFIGDYINIAAKNGLIHPIWNRVDANHTSIWTTAIPQSALGISTINFDEIKFNLHNSPNPFLQNTIIDFEIPNENFVNLNVFDINGKKVTTLISNQKMSKGKHQLNLDAKQNKLNAGTYICRLKSVNYTQELKITVVE